MPKLPRLTLKSFFEKGDKPTQGQFAAFLDSVPMFIDDKDILGLRQYSTTRFYSAGDTVVYLDSVYICLGDTSGSFDPPKWKNLVAFGAVIYLGAWNALTNNPPLATGAGTKGTYYAVSVSGSTNLDGITDWKAGDWAIFNGVAWEKVDNTEDQVAADIEFTPNGDITSTNVQDAIVEVRDDTDDKLDDKADKVAGATSGDIATLTASGNLSDSGFTLTDFLSKINTVPYTPAGDYNPATKKYVDDTATALGVPDKADKVVPAINDNFAALDAGGNLKDSLKSPADYLAKDNAVVYSPSTDYNPATKLYVDDGLDLKQDLDPTLTALAGLATGADQLPYATGTDTFSQTTLSAYGRSLIDDQNAAVARGTLGLGNSSTLNVGTTAGTVAAGDDARFTDARRRKMAASTTTAFTGSAAAGVEELAYSFAVSAGEIATGCFVNLRTLCRASSAGNAKIFRISVNTSNSLAGATQVGTVTVNNNHESFIFSREFAVRSATSIIGGGTATTDMDNNDFDNTTDSPAVITVPDLTGAHFWLVSLQRNGPTQGTAGLDYGKLNIDKV